MTLPAPARRPNLGPRRRPACCGTAIAKSQTASSCSAATTAGVHLGDAASWSKDELLQEALPEVPEARPREDRPKQWSSPWPKRIPRSAALRSIGDGQSRSLAATPNQRDGGSTARRWRIGAIEIVHYGEEVVWLVSTRRKMSLHPKGPAVAMLGVSLLLMAGYWTLHRSRRNTEVAFLERLMVGPEELLAFNLRV